MKNTKDKGKIRFLIYRSKHQYIGVCFELGIIEEADDEEKLIYRLKNGAQAMVKAVAENGLDDSHLNKNVSLKYYLYWYLSIFLKLRDSLILEQSKRIENFRNINNLAPSCI